MINPSRCFLGTALLTVALFQACVEGAEPPQGLRIALHSADRHVNRGSATPHTLSELKFVALAESPRLGEARARLAQAEADLREAGLYPNPVLQIEGEELPRNFSTGPGLTMYKINQAIVTGGKRCFRLRGAHARVTRAARAYEQEALEVARDVAKAYFDLLGARRRTELARSLLDLATRFRDIVKARVEGGSTRPIESDRAVVLAAQARAEIRKAEAELTIASQALALALGRSTLDISGVQGALEHNGGLPPFEDLAHLARERSPLLAIPAEDERAAAADLHLAHALKIPDIEFGLSVQHRNEPDKDHQLRGFQFEMPLPIFNSGQAARDKARAGIQLARAQVTTARTSLDNRLVQSYRTAQRAHEQVEIYLADVLPAAKHAVDLATEGYQAGKFTYLEVLDGQRSFATSMREYIDALVDYQKARAELEEIVAGVVPEIEEKAATTSSAKTAADQQEEQE